MTLYSDRTASQWLNESRPTGTAARFHISLEFERELGLNHWEKEAPKGEGVHLTFCPAKDNRLLTLAGRLKDYFLAIDLSTQLSVNNGESCRLWTKKRDQAAHVEMRSSSRKKKLHRRPGGLPHGQL